MTDSGTEPDFWVRSAAIWHVVFAVSLLGRDGRRGSRAHRPGGRRLYIGEATVKTHLLRVFTRLGVDDRTAAVTLAMQRGILRYPS